MLEEEAWFGRGDTYRRGCRVWERMKGTGEEAGFGDERRVWKRWQGLEEEAGWGRGGMEWKKRQAYDRMQGVGEEGGDRRGGRV
jgi:hypothetical protein